MPRKSLSEGLSAKSVSVRLANERIEKSNAGRQNHAEALNALRDWHARRVEQAKRKADDKPIALEILGRFEKWCAERPLIPSCVRLLEVIEKNLRDGIDVERRERKPSLREPPRKRPAWMVDASLLPKRPPTR